jgi:hypothetical protein
MERITYSPRDRVFGCSELKSVHILEFWQWAFGDLCDDDIKGIYAEWIVHKLLQVHTPRRIGWANSDIITPGGTRIEVKSTAYWQTWKFLDEHGRLEIVPKHTPKEGDIGIRFGGLKARDSTSVDWSKPPRFKSHLYVFAFQKERSIHKWNALDLSQWEFFLVKALELEQLKWKSVSLATLRTRFGALSASDLAARGQAAIQELETAKNGS